MAIAAVAALSGCISSGDDLRGPSKMPSDAITALWLMKSVADVQACRTQVEAPTSYQVRAANKPIGPYATIIVDTDRLEISDARRAQIASCP